MPLYGLFVDGIRLTRSVIESHESMRIVDATIGVGDGGYLSPWVSVLKPCLILCQNMIGGAVPIIR